MCWLFNCSPWIMLRRHDQKFGLLPAAVSLSTTEYEPMYVQTYTTYSHIFCYGYRLTIRFSLSQKSDCTCYKALHVTTVFSSGIRGPKLLLKHRLHPTAGGSEWSNIWLMFFISVLAWLKLLKIRLDFIHMKDSLMNDVTEENKWGRTEFQKQFM